MRANTFRGGVHPLHRIHEGKDATKALPMREYIASTVIIPMSQHIGAPCKPIVEVGQQVNLGQKIGEAGGFVSAPIHASVSGTVVAVEPRPHVTGNMVPAVVIENDFEDRPDPTIAPKGTVESLTPDEIKKIIVEAGIVGMGGATFPTHVKLALKEDQKVDTIILNGAECEPYLTGDHRMMLENSAKIVTGARALIKAAGAEKAVIGIETNKPDAVEAMKKAVEGYGDVEVRPLPTKYPQGGEKQLIFAITGRKVPMGGLPAAVGVIVDNVSTCAAIADAIELGMPLIKRPLTVCGDVNQPANLLCRIGTTFVDVIEQCGGYKGEPQKLLSGGPMMGFPQIRDDVPIIKGTSGVLVMAKKSAKHHIEGNCLRCGRCVDACPMNLMPQMINAAFNAGKIQMCEDLSAMNCINCGCCTFACPAERLLSQSIDLAKRAIAAKNRR